MEFPKTNPFGSIDGAPPPAAQRRRPSPRLRHRCRNLSSPSSRLAASPQPRERASLRNAETNPLIRWPCERLGRPISNNKVDETKPISRGNTYSFKTRIRENYKSQPLWTTDQRLRSRRNGSNRNLLLPTGVMVNALALALRVPVSRMYEIVNCKRAITPETALRLARYLGTSAEFWLGLQSDYDLERDQETRGMHRARSSASRSCGVAVDAELQKQTHREHRERWS